MCNHVIYGGTALNTFYDCPICGKKALGKYVIIGAKKPFPAHKRWFHEECWLLNMKKSREDYDRSKRINKTN